MNFKIIVVIYLKTTLQNVCTLTGQDPKKAYPSLVQCYKYNDSTCCTSQQDLVAQSQIIYDSGSKDSTTGLFTGVCSSQFNQLTDYICMGCNPKSMDYEDKLNHILYICSDYAETLWGGDISKPTLQFDQCGMWWGPDTQQEAILPSTVLIKYQKWATAQEFFSDNIPANYASIHASYSVQIVDPKSGILCFSSGNKIILHLIAFIIFIIL